MDRIGDIFGDRFWGIVVWKDRLKVDDSVTWNVILDDYNTSPKTNMTMNQNNHLKMYIS